MDIEGPEHQIKVVSKAQYRVLISAGGHERKPHCLTRTMPDGRMEIVFTKQQFDQLERIEREVQAEIEREGDSGLLQIEQPPTLIVPGDGIPDEDKKSAEFYFSDKLPEHPESSRRPSWFRGGFDPFGGR
jgi:hypothetical protein